MQDTNATAATPTAPMELDRKLSLLEALQLHELDLDLKLRLGDDTETTPSSETTTLSERQSSITSPRSSICSSNTSTTSARGSTAKPTKRVRFEESVSCSFFEENLEHLARPPLHKRPSFVQRSWDRIKTRNSSVESEIALASIPATTRNPYTITRRSSSSDLLEASSNAAKRPLLAPKSLSYTIQQPLRESAGRKYDEAQTIAYYRTKPTTAKGDWDDLLGPAKTNTMAV
ncbi:uncharacterized protein MYCFIDRAFT_211578 [Pseudocercospora fijiensis CIRAD86]|uniref:Uncharacterized protein n=1 Tax=Pseudocercospora fijiensis (strain CIRAD86) TaxID=383855 RepID=M2YX49_PSEFD|nr:uncharacterized protein MYCFIDRAFT_211578 [Pseudocercospora fijiensis CIRAD86]EME82265.1 hypothetical protein MYCFIDRAFT_211578 [Pseudocercospora fijiensis CIRAD86]